MLRMKESRFVLTLSLKHSNKYTLNLIFVVLGVQCDIFVCE